MSDQPQPITNSPGNLQSNPPLPASLDQVNTTGTVPANPVDPNAPTNQAQDPTSDPIAPSPAEGSDPKKVIKTKSSKKEPSTPVTSKQIHAGTNSRIQLFSIGLTIAIGINFGLYYLNRGKIKQLSAIRQQLAVVEQNTKNVQNTESFLTNQVEQIQLVLDALPNEDTLIDFVQTLETVASQSSRNSSLEFNALAPKGKDSKYIPFVIKMSTDSPNFIDFLSKLEKLPYLVQVTDIKSTKINQDSDVWDFNISARVYVQDPFQVKS